uniref:Uncharacterized protein n=1 Tax=Romanomermis culicivorax TaxID=13658 RepID=A0A915HQ96_ROMCU
MPKGHLYLRFSMERNRMESTQPYRMEGKFSFRSVWLEITVGRFLQNCSYPSRSKVDFQAERFKLLLIRTVPFRSVEKGKSRKRQE